MTDESKELKKECCVEAEDCCRHKHREASEVEALPKRLNRIEGQVRGLRGMVEAEAYGTDIVTHRIRAVGGRGRPPGYDTKTDEMKRRIPL